MLNNGGLDRIDEIVGGVSEGCDHDGCRVVVACGGLSVREEVDEEGYNGCTIVGAGGPR